MKECVVTACHEIPFITDPTLLCREHALTVSLNVTDILHANARSALAPNEADIARTRVAPKSVWRQQSHGSVVYFLTNGDRVKIGTSTNITARVSALALRKANAALLLQGGNDLESALHAHFADDRIGNTEWFVLSPSIQSYIAHRKKADAALQQPLLPADGTAPVVIPAPRPPIERPLPAAQRIIATLTEFTDPLGIDTTYVHKDDIGRKAGVEGQTLANTLSQLVKAEQIHRGPEAGTYGLGPEQP